MINVIRILVLISCLSLIMYSGAKEGVDPHITLLVSISSLLFLFIIGFIAVSIKSKIANRFFKN